MELQQIKYFLAVVDNGTFLAASQQAFVTQPTLSAGIKKLESSLGVKLFHRGSRQANLTPAGQEFLPVARQTLGQLMAIKSSLNNEPKKLVIGVLANIHMDQVAKLVGLFRQQHPHVMIEFVVAPIAELNQAMEEERIDLAIVNNHAKAENFISLIPEQMCIAVSHKHPLANHPDVALNVLHAQPFIERMHCGFWTEVNQAFERRQIQPHKVMQAENDEFVLSLVAEDLGVSIMTNRTTPYAVKFVPLHDFAITQSIGLTYRPSQQSQLSKQFCDILVEHFGNT